MSIKLNSFDYDLIEQYYIQNILQNEFWLFCSHGNESEKPVSQNSDFDSKEVLEKLVFGAQFNEQDVSFMVPFIPWEQGKIYTQYDDKAVLKDMPFYVVVEPEIESGNYHIFKCLSNNNASPSENKPEFNPSIQDGLYNLDDGYVWKYVTSTTSTLFRKFAARGLIPVLRNQQVESIADTGIYNIVVETENNGYERITGFVQSTDTPSGTTKIFLSNLFSETFRSTPIFDVPDFYSNRSIYIKKEFEAIELRIRSSGVEGGLPFVVVSTPPNFTIGGNDEIEILPRVEIVGNGQGATAIPIFDESNTRIVSVRMITYGDGYTNATARIVDPVSFDPSNENRQDIRCEIRLILSPLSGHGSNVLRELNVKDLGLSKIINSFGQSEIPSSGSYSKIAIVKNPEFDAGFDGATFDNRVQIELESLPANIQVGNTVTQDDASGIVHEIDESTNTIFLINYEGPNDGVFVSNQPVEFQGSTFEINNIEYSPYISLSGSVLAIADLTPVERDEERSEQIKLILDF